VHAMRPALEKNEYSAGPASGRFAGADVGQSKHRVEVQRHSVRTDKSTKLFKPATSQFASITKTSTEKTNSQQGKRKNASNLLAIASAPTSEKKKFEFEYGVELRTKNAKLFNSTLAELRKEEEQLLKL